MGSTDKSSTPDENFVINALEVLDEEKQNILIEVLKCAVCLEVPKQNLVLICEKGHHFCSSCHKKQKICGICRGELLQSRNFVVEELVAKLGPVLGVSKPDSLPPGRPVKYPQGSFKCPHKCRAKVPAFRMIPHIRDKHSESLIDNVRTNPYTGQFCGVFDVVFNSDHEYLLSVQISDMGFLTVFVCFKKLDLFSFIKILGDEAEIDSINYDLVITTKTSVKPAFQYSISGCPVVSYEKDLETIDCEMLRISEEELLRFLTVGSRITVNFSIYRISEGTDMKDKVRPLLLANDPLKFSSDRKRRRNRNRNERRQRVLKLLESESGEAKFARNFSGLTIAF